MTTLNDQLLKQIIEAALLAADEPLSLDQLLQLFSEEERPEKASLKQLLAQLANECETRGIELKEIASGFRFQVKQDLAPWIQKLWEERTPRYSRALLETLALIVYKQPITRAEIEDVRGVTVSSHIIKTLQDREWIEVTGHKEVPGRPALFGTTKRFLDDFNLKSLKELPTLAALQDLEAIEAKLNNEFTQTTLLLEPIQQESETQ